MSRTPKTYACSHAWIYSLALPLTLSLSMLLIVTAWPIISLVSHQAFFFFFFSDRKLHENDTVCADHLVNTGGDEHRGHRHTHYLLLYARQ